MNEEINSLIKYLCSQEQYQGYAWIEHDLKGQGVKMKNLTVYLAELERRGIFHTQIDRNGKKQYLMLVPFKEELKNLNHPYQYLLEKEAKEERDKNKISWPQRNWLWIAVITFLLTSIVAPIVVETWKANLLPTPTEGQLKFEKNDTSQLDKTNVLPTAIQTKTDTTKD